MKKLFLVLFVLLLLVAGGAYYLFSNLDSLIKRGIETYGSAATGTHVTLARAHVDLQSGKGELTGLTIGAPKGYQQTPFQLGAIAIALDTASLTSGGPITVRELNVDTPHITYELDTNGGNNLATIASNARRYAASLQKTSPDAAAKSEKSTASSEPRFIIRRVLIRGAALDIVQPLLPGQHLSTTLPDIILTDVGAKTGGATAAEIADQLLSVVIDRASAAALRQINNPAQLIKQLPGQVGKTLNNGLQKLLGN